MNILRPTRIAFATGNIISDILLYFVTTFLSCQYILIKCHVQICLPSYTIQVNIAITRSLGSNKSNRVISESCYTKKSTRKRFQKRMSNNRKTIVIISGLVCTSVTCYVTPITYNNNNNIIGKLSLFFAV